MRTENVLKKKMFSVERKYFAIKHESMEEYEFV